jgi:hypothetical protein
LESSGALTPGERKGSQPIQRKPEGKESEINIEMEIAEEELVN